MPSTSSLLKIFSPVQSFFGGRADCGTKDCRSKFPIFDEKVKEPNVTIAIPVSGSDTI